MKAKLSIVNIFFISISANSKEKESSILDIASKTIEIETKLLNSEFSNEHIYKIYIFAAKKFYHLNQYNLAKKYLLKAMNISANVNKEKAYYYLSMSYRKLGDNKNALKTLDKWRKYHLSSKWPDKKNYLPFIAIVSGKIEGKLSIENGVEREKVFLGKVCR